MMFAFFHAEKCHCRVISYRVATLINMSRAMWAAFVCKSAAFRQQTRHQHLIFPSSILQVGTSRSIISRLIVVWVRWAQHKSASSQRKDTGMCAGWLFFGWKTDNNNNGERKWERDGDFWHVDCVWGRSLNLVRLAVVWFIGPLWPGGGWCDS